MFRKLHCRSSKPLILGVTEGFLAPKIPLQLADKRILFFKKIQSFNVTARDAYKRHCIFYYYSITYLLTNLVTYLLTHSLIHSLTHSVTHSLTHSFTLLLTNLRTYILTYLLTCLLIYLLTYLLQLSLHSVAVVLTLVTNKNKYT